MSAKDKANELVEKFYKSMFDIKLSDTHIMNTARQCSIICVEEILKALKYPPNYNRQTIKVDTLDYWQEVLTHLKEML